MTRPIPVFGQVAGIEHRRAARALLERTVGVLQDRDRRTVALPAAVDGREAALDDLAEDVVERADEFRRVGVVAHAGTPSRSRHDTARTPSA